MTSSNMAKVIWCHLNPPPKHIISPVVTYFVSHLQLLCLLSRSVDRSGDLHGTENSVLHCGVFTPSYHNFT